MGKWLFSALAVISVAFVGPSAAAQHREPEAQFVIWGHQSAPGTAEIESCLEELIIERSGTPDRIRDRYAVGITRPRLLVFQPEHPNGAALLMLPGGGYQRVVIDKEGIESAERFNRAGVTVFILLYRLPAEGHEQGHNVPLQDAQRALRLIRYGAVDPNIDPERVGVIGFSAGGHLAGTLATRFDAGVHAQRDDVDEISARPDFAVLVYPVTRMSGPAVHAGSRDRLIGAQPDAATVAVHDLVAAARSDAPPLFLLHAMDDVAVPVENSLDVFAANRALGVPVEMHVFAEGGHGFGIRFAEGLPVGAWPDLVLAWMARGGFLTD
ncbi:alpha/beta hydrolase [Maricaulis maris]|jgi:acetyl esterase/lipase|uniref:Pectin acetylesterase n=1 Tax=Maricaulis maris (strain MCS10) TaxID=394221 RepID=Q0AT68_MARMM|nr:alpha/beta hydrolase [Maricaulis maris]ABI64519.1 pectin acetylesterase [Maricaulis maris MCS10]